jgi:hypothetical protein
VNASALASLLPVRLFPSPYLHSFFFFIQIVSCDGRTGVSDLKAPLCFVPSFPFLIMSCGPIFPDLKVSDCLHDSGAIFVQRVAAAALNFLDRCSASDWPLMVSSFLAADG